MRARARTLIPLALAAALAFSLVADARTGRPWPHPGSDTTESGHPEVLFTFDDGPDEERTAVVLDTLAKHGVKAVFFWNGYRVDRPSRDLATRKALVKRAISEGHLIGNHTVNHARLCKVGPVRAAREIDGNQTTYEELTGMPLLLLRAPYGDRCASLLALLRQRKLTNLHWDVDPREWRRTTWRSTAAHVIGEIRKLRGRAVILMHDTKLTTMRSLPRILEWIDAENALRAKSGKPTIRVISGSDWIASTRDASLLDWALESSARARARAMDAGRRLVPGQVTVARVGGGGAAPMPRGSW